MHVDSPASSNFVLAALSFRDSAVAEHAAQLADHLNRDLRLIHVDGPHGDNCRTPAQTSLDALTSARLALNEAKGYQHIEIMTPVGDPLGRLEASLEEQDLLVIGSGHEPIEEHQLGDFTLAVIGKLRRPVFVVMRGSDDVICAIASHGGDNASKNALALADALGLTLYVIADKPRGSGCLPCECFYG